VRGYKGISQFRNFINLLFCLEDVLRRFYHRNLLVFVFLLIISSLIYMFIVQFYHFQLDTSIYKKLKIYYRQYRNEMFFSFPENYSDFDTY